MAFPFLQLPRELRDQIYEYALICKSRFCLYRHSDFEDIGNASALYYSGEPIMNLFLVSHEINQEAVMVFYGKTMFNFHGLLVERAIHLFLTTVPDHLLAKIRKVHLSLENIDTSDQSSHRKHLSWPESLDILASKCRLTHLKIDIYCDCCSLSQDIDESTILSVQTWLNMCTSIRGLHRLVVNIMIAASEADFIRQLMTQVIPTAVKMKTCMLNNGHNFDSDSLHGVRIRVDPRLSDPTFDDDSYSDVKIDLDQYGKTPLENEWRVRVYPDVWCPACGQFEGEGAILSYCGCKMKGMCRARFRFLSQEANFDSLGTR